MITHDARRSLSRGNNPVPSPWQATAPAAAARTTPLITPSSSARAIHPRGPLRNPARKVSQIATMATIQPSPEHGVNGGNCPAAVMLAALSCRVRSRRGDTRPSLRVIT
jgi:hypothetical protein